MPREDIQISFWKNLNRFLLSALLLAETIFGFVNSPKIITKDGNLIFESGMNRNITFRLSGKSRLMINDQYDLLDLILLRKSLRNSSISDVSGGDIEWFNGDNTNLNRVIRDVATLKALVYGSQGINNRLHDLQNRTTSSTQNLRRLQTRLQRFETRLQTLSTRLELDSCKSNPCENGGTCFNLYNGFMCKCTSNFEGPTCEKDVNECALFAGTDMGCQNGQCLNQFGGYSCICSPGWFGIHCTQRKGDCLQFSAWEVCGHGACVPAAGNDNFGYKCICEQGWKTNGLTPACTVDVNECTESHPPCSTECINLPGSFTCAPCSGGLEGNGISCRDINECATNNGGCSLAPRVPCINTYGSYHCGECPIGWTGDGRTCIRADSNENSVLNANCSNANVCYPGATCTEISNTVVCTCPPGMIGNGIGINGCVTGTAKNCGSFPCLNGGTCVDSGESYMCICPVGFKQPNCTPAQSPCIPNPCLNNGRCRPTGGTTFQCQCAPGYVGRLCNNRFSRCGGVLSGVTGRLKYPEGSLYDHNSQCAWLLRTNETKVLNVTFHSFDLEDTTECRFDWLQINDGRTAASQVIGRFCGSNKPMGGNIISSTNFLYLWFRSDNSTAREGFDLEWNSIPPQCGGIIEVQSHGSIATPGSPGAYPKNRDCRWRLSAPNNKRIKLTFFSMQIENHQSCEYDYVEITDSISGALLEKFCNSSRPAPLLLPTNEATIHFHSDNEGSDTGFQIYYSLEERTPGCGGTFTAKEGTIKSPAIIGDSISCEYEIKMPKSESITIEFTKFQMGKDDCVEIYDVNHDNGIVELQSKYCGGYDFMPSVFHSLYNEVQIKYFSKGGIFELHYKTDCFYTYESISDVILSPGYPNLTKAEHFCTYKIIGEPGTVISLHVVDFDLRDTSLEDKDCAFSFLRINEVPENAALGPFCNEQQPPVDYVSKSNMVVVLFQSGATSLGKGFKIEYRTLPMKQSDCGGVYTKPGYTIRLPTNNEGQYANDLECYWVIMAPQGKGIAINWKSFSLEGTFDCNYDYVELYDNLANSEDAKPLGRYCDARPPPSFLSHSRMLTIKFVSDYSDTAEGFEATYSFVNMTDQCGGEIFSSTGKLYSPGWPGNYSNELDCVWIITSQAGSQIELQIIMFELEEQRNQICESDWLEIRNGGSANSSIIGKFCGQKIPHVIPSFTNQLHLHFHTDHFISGRGFEISWHVYSSGCGGVLKADTGVITSPLYPNPYPNDSTCEWRILVHKGSAIQITIEDIDIEELFQCNYDFIEIFDGHSIVNKPLARLCKTDDVKQYFETKSNEALIRFQTDNSNSQRGFLLSYVSNCTRTITDIHGSIESPNFGEPYYDDALSCAWTLKAPKGNKINLELIYFDTTQHGHIYLRDNANSSSKMLTISGLQNYESTGDSLTIIQNSTDVTFSLEFAMVGCIQSLHRETGEFQSPNFPKTYPNNIECMWDITVPFGQGIELTVEWMDIEESVNCTKDGLQISNEVNSTHPKERHCGKRNAETVITSSSHRLFVRFYSDSVQNGKGFNVTYKTINSTCGGIIKGRNGVITSPNYPLNYPPNVLCEWRIQVQEHHTIRLVLDELDIEDFYDCEMDALEAYDVAAEDEANEDHLLFKKCGTLEEDSETDWVTNSNTAMIRFRTDDSSELKGFKIQFEEHCGERILMDEEYFGYIDITKHAQNNETCQWKLIAKDVTKRVLLSVSHSQLTPLMAMTYGSENDCINHGVEIRDGLDEKAPLRSKFCKVHPPAITSHGHALTVIVPMNVIGEFEADFYLMTDICGGSYNSLFGKFASPNYPSSYPVNIGCEYYLMAKPGNSMVLTFESMDLELSDDCNADYVEIRESDEAGPLLGVYCGTMLPPPIQGKENIWVKFHSDNENVGMGFLASYNYAFHNELNGTRGIIESPKYPSKFHSDQSYSWRIVVEKDFVVLLTLEHIVDVDIPYIKFYDGYSDIGAEIDYSTSHVVRSNTNILYFTALRGPFKFKWERLGKDAVRANRTAEENLKACGNPLIWVSDVVTFSSPGYPNGYSDNIDCSWIILAKNTASHAVLQFRTIDLEEFSNCFADYVVVSSSTDMENWKELDKLCKKDASSIQFYHGTPYLKLDFVTDSSHNKTGFSTFLKTACGSVLSQQRDVINITELATGANMFQMDCVWTINVRRGRRVRITFDETYFRNPNDTTDSCRSYFLVRNGIDEDSPFLGKGKYCDNDITDILDTTTNRAYVKFVRVGFPRFRAVFRYEEITHECSDDIELSEDPFYDTRTIMSPNYPNIANPHTECIWKIAAPAHHIIAIHFLEKFELAPGSGPLSDACDHEYVQLNDGATDLMPMIGRYCGKTKPDTKYTTGNLLRVKYFTDVAEPKVGFMANVSIARCGGFFYGNDGVVRSPSNIVLQGEHPKFECVYTFEAPDDNVVQVDIATKLSEANNCSTVSHLELQEIDSYGEIENVTDTTCICGEHTKRYLVETNKLVIRYRIIDNSHRTDSFTITYKMLGSRCGETIVANTGVLQTPGYPNGVPRPTHCVWRLRVAKGRRIKIDFLDFDTGATLLANSSSGQTHAFRGRITFANDFEMQSIITRITDNPPAKVYSTDNTMTIDAFLLSIGRHRGFKLRFTSYEESDICRSSFGVQAESSVQFRSSPIHENYCSYNLAPLPNHTMVLTVDNYQQYEETYLGNFVCEIFAPLKLQISDRKLKSNLFCENSTFPLTLRFPYPITMHLIGNKRNKLRSLDVKRQSFECGGIFPAFPIYIGENTTIGMPQMKSNFSGPLDCAWAVWASDGQQVQDWKESEYWSNIFQVDIALTTNFVAKCEEEFLLLYNGPDQNSPALGRYCGTSTAANLVAENGLFVEYHSSNYQRQSTFNITAKPGSGCGGKLMYPYRSISFDDQYYKNNVECIWEIETEPGFHIGVVFKERFFIESSPGCKKDYLKIQQRDSSSDDWEDLKILCGRDPPKVVNATTTQLRMIFRSDNDTVGEGFKAKFERNCGGILYATNELKELSSPGYPNSLPNNLFCHYTIESKHVGNTGILLRFKDFDIESPPIKKCLFDNVTIVQKENDEEIKTVLCGIKKDYEIRANKRVSLIVQTDSTFPSKGFLLYYSNKMCGGLITNTTIVESPHQQGDGTFPPNSNCIWNITAPEGHKIIIKFEELDYEAQTDCSFDSVEIYKGPMPATSARIAKFCGNMTGQLPFLSVASNTAIIRSHSDERDPSRGFKALISFTINCDKEIYLGMGNLTYEMTTFSGSYSNNLDCSYVFKTDPGRQLQVKFNSFHIEEKPSCTADFLELRDGAGPFSDEMGRFCGHVLPTPLTSSQNVLFMRFVSDSNVTSTGFSAEVTSVPLLCGSHNIVLEDSKKFTLKSPGYDSGSYPGNINCVWKIKAEATIHIKFHEIDIEDPTVNETCVNDYLKMYNSADAEMIEKGYGTQLILNSHAKGVNFMNFATEYTYCGKYVPDDFFSYSHEVYIKFKTNENGTGKGFHLEAMPAVGCYRNFTGTQGRIFIADTSDHCDIHLKAPQNYSLSLYFNTVSFSKYDCESEYIEVFDAHNDKSLKKICGYVDVGKSLFLTTNELRMRIKMDTRYTEFDITYLASRDGPGCGGDIYNTAGLIASPFYPDNVRNNSICVWNIRVPFNLHVLLRFMNFDMGAKATCISDYLQIIEHDNENVVNGTSHVVRQFCGGDDPKIYKSSHSYLTIRFHKTVNFDGTGWVIQFNGVYSNYKIPSYYLNDEYSN